MNDPVLSALLHVSDMLISEGILVHPSAIPDRVSRIQAVVFEPEVSKTHSKRAIEIAAEPGTINAVAQMYGVTINTVRTYRSRFGPKSSNSTV